MATNCNIIPSNWDFNFQNISVTHVLEILMVDGMVFELYSNGIIWRKLCIGEFLGKINKSLCIHVWS